MTDEIIIYENPDHPNEEFIRLNELRKEGTNCDVILQVNYDSFYTHQNVLVVSSGYFQRLFALQMPENHPRVIPIYDVQSYTVVMVLDYMYNGLIEINKDNVKKLWYGFEYFDVLNVKEKCTDFLKKMLKEEFNNKRYSEPFHDLWEIRERATSLENTRLVAIVDNLIGFNLMEYMKTKEFLELNMNQLSNLIQSDNLFAKTEEIVFEAMLNWIKFWENDRVRFLLEVFAKIRLNLLSRKFLIEKVSKDRLIHKSEPCKELIQLRLNVVEEYVENSLSRFNEQVKQIYVLGGNFNEGSMEKYDPALEEWFEAGYIPSKRNDMGLAVLHGKIYIMGGHISGNIDHISTIEYFDPKINEWNNQLSDMLMARSFPTATVRNNFIYVFGGCNDTGKLDCVERYNPSFDNWLMLQSMMEKRMSAVAVTLEDYLYVMGGFDDNDCALNTMERYNPQTNAWNPVKPMLIKRGSFGATILDGKIYVCGGDNGERVFEEVEVYDPNQDEWELVQPMNVKRTSLAVVTNLGKIWAIGGISDLRDGENDECNGHDTMEVYDPDTKIWTFECSMSVIRDNHVAAVIP